jgi:hypothetical protein
VKTFGRVLPWLLLLVAVADWIALRRGSLSHPAWVLAAAAGAVIVSFAVRLGAVAWSLSTRRGKPAPAIGEALLLTGVLVALVAGMANWTLRLQGFVILKEGEAVPLHQGSHLQQFDGGPLARMDEMNVILTLEELELLPAGNDLFYPESHLRVQHGAGAPERLSTGVSSSGSVGPLRFHQGAFGFAPRIVILENDETVFDEVVPFTTRREGASGINFEGSFTIEREGLAVHGSVDLENLDEAMRGHATLALLVKRGETLLGRGRLLPGHFADLEQGYRSGFAGLHKWSEIDVSRRTYRSAVLAGTALALGGAVFWPIAVWRNR